MKSYIIVFSAITLSFFLPNHIMAQSEEIIPIEVFQGLRKIISSIAIHPKDTCDNQYLAYTYEVRFGKEGGVFISYTESTHWRLRNKQADDEARIMEFINENNIRFAEELIILYPILMVWKDRKERKNNLTEVMDGLFDDGRNYSSNIRVENPIVVYLGEVIINKKIF